MSASPQSPPACAPDCGNPLRQLPPAEWRVLLQLLESIDALPTIAARERWLCRLQRDDPALGDALQRLLLRRNRLQVTRFLHEPVVAPGSLHGGGASRSVV